MKLSIFKSKLHTVDSLNFQLPSLEAIPSHFHITEVGVLTKHFIDCGGTERHEKLVSFQLWTATDTHHRLAPENLQKIIALAENKLGVGDYEIEVEYQSDTIGKYGVEFKDGQFWLTAKKTNCLALEACGLPAVKKKITNLIQETDEACCTPESGCC